MGPDRNKHLRNIAIIFLLAAAVWGLPGGEAGGQTVSNLLGIVFWSGIVFLLYRLYMENRMTIMGLEDRQRGMLYAGLGMVVIALVATGRLWDQGGLGALLWFALVLAGGFAVLSVWRTYREY
jgi:hypothetical protein